MNFLKKLFGSKSADTEAVAVVEETLKGLFESGGFDLEYSIVSSTDEEIQIEMSGADEQRLTEKDGALLDAIQFLLKRVLQHRVQGSRIEVTLDVNGFRDENSQSLIDLAERMKEMVLEKRKPVYLKALPPKDRKVIHQYLAEDTRVKSRSVGDGHYKRIKIFPVGAGGGRRDHDQTEVSHSSSDA